MERDFICSSTTGKRLAISTHTLTWSVTENANKLRVLVAISTHTLTWSVTLTDAQFAQIGIHFNSHAHVERDIYIR